MTEHHINQERKKVIQLCSDKFLENFHPDFLDSIELIPWRMEFGAKDKLCFLPRENYAGIIVGADLSYSKNNILFWARIIGPRGALILEATPYMLPEIIERNYSHILKNESAPQSAVWIFKKKATPTNAEMRQQLIDGIENNLSDNEMLQLIDRLEQYDPLLGDVMAPSLTRLKIYKKYQLDQLALNEAQRYSEVIPVPSYPILAALNKIGYSDKLYHGGFIERKLVMDKYGARTATPPPKDFDHLRWNGESLDNKTIVIWTEFGLGDEIMFAQLAYYFKLKGAHKIILVAQDPIVTLLKSSKDIDVVLSVAETEEQLGEFDYWTYPYDILAYVNIPFSQVRKRSPYLFSNPQLVEEYEPLFTNNECLKVGIVWKGSQIHENDLFRSIHDLKQIEGLFMLPNINWYCFQKECSQDELDLLDKYHIPHITKAFTDFSQTAAAMEHLDYLVTVDTSSAHVAGALGIPTLLLLPYVEDWRWQTFGSTNLWYPNTISFRCKAPESNWEKPIDELKQFLLQANTFC